MQLAAVIHKEGRWYVALNPETGVASQGKNLEEALANLKEAVELFLEDGGAPDVVGQPVSVTIFEVDHGSKDAGSVVA